MVFSYVDCEKVSRRSAAEKEFVAMTQRQGRHSNPEPVDRAGDDAVARACALRPTVDQLSEWSFPASDAPAVWTWDTGPRAPSPTPAIRPMRVVIVGGGVGALEALMALHDLGEQQLRLTVLSAQADFVPRAMAVAVPFSAGHMTRVPIADICAEFGARHHRAAVVSVDGRRHRVTCDDGTHWEFDLLVLATGAIARPAYASALTFDASAPTRLNGLLADIEEGYCRSLALVVPPGATWSLPIYELALLIARDADGASIDELAIHVVTPEAAPLAVFGPAASATVSDLLTQAGVEVHVGSYATVLPNGVVEMAPGERRLEVTRVVALPRTVGRPVPGVPTDDDGFVPVDDHCRVSGLPDVYAVGDATSFPLKQGGLAAQQAVVAARHIAARAGAPVEAQSFRPVLRGKLLTGHEPRFMRSEIAGGGGEATVSLDSPWWPPAKTFGHYLAPWLSRNHGLRATAHPDTPRRPYAQLRAQALAQDPLGPLRRPGRW
jgi:sulfide:quinone oxidoreductase